MSCLLIGENAIDMSERKTGGEMNSSKNNRGRLVA